MTINYGISKKINDTIISHLCKCVTWLSPCRLLRYTLNIMHQLCKISHRSGSCDIAHINLWIWIASYISVCVFIIPIAYESVPQSDYDNSPTIIYVNRPKVTTQTQQADDTPDMNHLLHCIICLIFPPWIIIWLCLCIMYYTDFWYSYSYN